MGVDSATGKLDTKCSGVNRASVERQLSGDGSWTLSAWSVSKLAPEDAELLRTPEDLVCPISHELFVDPVLVASGHVYERSTIDRHLQHSGLDPLTREDLSDSGQTPVFVLRSRAAEFRTRTMTACLARAASPGCQGRAELLRRATELSLGGSVLGGPGQRVLRAACRRGPTGDAGLARAFAEDLQSNGNLVAAGIVYHALACDNLPHPAPARGGRVRALPPTDATAVAALRHCVECWTEAAERIEGSQTAVAQPMCAETPGPCDEGGIALMRHTWAVGAQSAHNATIVAPASVLDRLVDASTARGGTAPSWTDLLEALRVAGFDRTFRLGLCESILLRQRLRVSAGWHDVVSGQGGSMIFEGDKYEETSESAGRGPPTRPGGGGERAVTLADYESDTSVLLSYARIMNEEAVEIQQDVARWVEEARRPAWSPIWTPAWLANPTVVTGLMALSSALPSSDRLTVRCIRAAGTFILCASLTK